MLSVNCELARKTKKYEAQTDLFRNVNHAFSQTAGSSSTFFCATAALCSFSLAWEYFCCSSASRSCSLCFSSSHSIRWSSTCLEEDKCTVRRKECVVIESTAWRFVSLENLSASCWLLSAWARAVLSSSLSLSNVSFSRWFVSIRSLSEWDSVPSWTPSSWFCWSHKSHLFQVYKLPWVCWF